MSTKWRGLWTIPHTWSIPHSRVHVLMSNIRPDISDRDSGSHEPSNHAEHRRSQLHGSNDQNVCIFYVPQ